jgi:hypothetical protein
MAVYKARQFCPLGHNKIIEGKFENGHCIACSKLPKKQICIHGIDTFICGRTGRACNECRRIADRKTRQFCPRGHDTFVTGRNKRNRRCLACANFPGKQFCVHGHNTWVTGRYGKHCKVCIDIKNRKYERIQRKININFRVACALRNRLYSALRGNWKTGSAIKDLGCSMDFLIAYLQEQFYADMTWDNWGTYWEIDHIGELADFDLSKRSQLLKAVNYTNLRPLTKPDHWKKSAQAKRDRKNKS